LKKTLGHAGLCCGMSILVGSPQIFEAECRTPRRVQLANAFCRFFEMANRLTAE
jgi:uncharacterized protein